MSKTVYFHSEDLDGWLAVPNHSILPAYLPVLGALQGLAVEEAGVRHEIQIVLNSGKPPQYLEAEARRFGGQAVISGNGTSWRKAGGMIQRVARPNSEFGLLREALELSPEAEDVVEIRMGRHRVQVVLEGKFDAAGDIAISFFPEHPPVSHRWSFTQGTDRWELMAFLRALIAERGWALSVAEPHPDGAVDVLPRIDGRPVGKWTMPRLAPRIFPGAELRITHGGNELNDVDAMEAPEVLPLTAANCSACVAVAARRGGVVATRPAPEGGASIECYHELARRGFYGPLSHRVAEICGRFLGAASR